MLRIALAFRAFFRVLFHGAAEELARSSKSGEAAVAEKPGAAPPAPKPARAPAAKPAPARNDALNLLAALTARGPLGRLHQRADQRVQRCPGRRRGPRYPPRLRLAHRAHFCAEADRNRSLKVPKLSCPRASTRRAPGSPAMSPASCQRPANCAIMAGRPRAANCLNGPAVRKPSASWLPRKLKSNSRRGHWEGEAPAEPRVWNRTPDDTDDTEKEYVMLVRFRGQSPSVSARQEPRPPEIVKLDSKEHHFGRARPLPSRASGIEPRMTPMTWRKNT